MIMLTEGLPAGVVIADAHGEVTRSDYQDILVPALSTAGEGRTTMRLMYVLADDFSGFEAGAALDDMRVGLGHWSDFERIAVVTDHHAYRTVTTAFGFLMPGLVRAFTLSERDAATEWILSG